MQSRMPLAPGRWLEELEVEQSCQGVRMPICDQLPPTSAPRKRARLDASADPAQAAADAWLAPLAPNDGFPCHAMPRVAVPRMAQ